MKLANRFRCIFQDHLADYITAIAWSSSDTRTLAAVSAAGELVRWQQTHSSEWDRFEIKSCVANRSSQQDALDCLGFSADGQFLAVGGQAGTLLVWKIHASDSELILDRSFPSIWLDQLAWHPNQNHLAIGVGRRVFLWDMHQVEPFRILEFEDSSILGLAWHPSGQYLAVSGQGGVKIWDVQDRQKPPTILEVPGASLSASWSTQGTFLASGNLDRTLSVLDWENPPPWLMQGFPGKVSHVNWTNGSQSPVLAASSMDGITIWQQRRDLNWSSHVLTEHQGLIRDIAFQPQGDLLISVGDDSEVLVWSGLKKLQQKLKGPTQGTHCLAWHHLGEQVVLGGRDGTVMIFESQNNGKGFG